MALPVVPNNWLFTLFIYLFNIFPIMANARMTLKDFCTSKGYNLVSKVRVNSNGYPYVTLVDKNDAGNSENLYLGQRYAAEVKVDDRLPLAELFVVETINDAGETRFKLSDRNGELSATKLADYDSI